MDKVITYFEVVGTKKIGVGLCARMGTTSLEFIVEHQIKGEHGLSRIFLGKDIIDEKNENDKKYVIVLRDIFDKWKSGYWMELQNKETLFYRSNVLEFFNKNIYRNGFTNKDDSAVNTALEVMTLLHDPKSPYGTDWMFKGHGEFWKWNTHNEIPLSVYSQLSNIYFLELKDLSNPKFLEWLKEQDEDWKVVKKIPHKNSSYATEFWPQIKLFWTEYDDGGGLILQDKVLVCPLSKRHLPVAIMNIFKQEQMTIDFIRKNHKRYLKFD